MATVPTGKLERELRALYVKWVAGLPKQATQAELQAYIQKFRTQSTALIEKLGGQAARLGVSADFPAPKELDLSHHLATVYSDMETAAVRASIATGLNARTSAAAMVRAGFERSYAQLERLARTETVSAYWANQWNEAEGLGLVMLWSAETGSRTCPWCLAKDGLLVEDKSIRDHPNGRCTLLPTLPSRVPLRGKGANPKFRRLPWDGNVPRELDQVLGRGLDHALVASAPASEAITGMVSQGWTSAQAAQYLMSTPGNAVANLTREGYSQILRALEQYAQELWNGLAKNVTPSVLYRGGNPTVTGLSSWTSKRETAQLYAQRKMLYKVDDGLYEMEIPKGTYAYKLKNNAMQDEYLVLGTPRVVTSQLDDAGMAIHKGVLNGATPMRAPGAARTSISVAEAAPASTPLAPMSASQANKWAAENMLDVKTLPSAVKEQITLYTGGGYRGTNRALRSGVFTGSNGQVQREMVKGLDEAMKLSRTPEDLIVSRVVTEAAIPGGNPAALIGKTMTDKGYLSTALGGKVSGIGFTMANVEMQITVPAGTPAIWTKPLSQFKGERELLLDRNTKLEIVSAELNERTGKWLVQATVKK